MGLQDNMRPVETDNIGNDSIEALITKRVALSEKNITLLKMMSPLYQKEIGSSKESDLTSHMINLGIRCLFDTDYKDRINEL